MFLCIFPGTYNISFEEHLETYLEKLDTGRNKLIRKFLLLSFVFDGGSIGKLSINLILKNESKHQQEPQDAIKQKNSSETEHRRQGLFKFKSYLNDYFYLYMSSHLDVFRKKFFGKFLNSHRKKQSWSVFLKVHGNMRIDPVKCVSLHKAF